MKTLILNTDIVRIELSGDGFETYIKCQDGGWLQHATFPPGQEGLVNALDLATNCAAGKFYPKRYIPEQSKDARRIGFDTRLIPGGRS